MVIFIVGGTTYEEARMVSMQNAAQNGTRVLLGGSVVLNSSRYVAVWFELFIFLGHSYVLRSVE